MRRWWFGRRYPPPGAIVAALIFIALLVVAAAPLFRRTVRRPVRGPACRMNLRQLGLALRTYADEHGAFPPAETWCDTLAAEYALVPENVFRCPSAGEGRCHYAMNPLATAESPGDVVLLFECDAGWNRSGQREALATDHHVVEGCNILFVDGTVSFTPADQVGTLRWGDETTLGAESGNSRRPSGDEELRYWLENMVWYHQFGVEEVRAATGLTEQEILAAQERFGIRPGGGPEREPNAPLLVLPYPGGRHPRIGFLEGAIDPQRETKFSVFTPWDPNSYVVLDVPEAIWSNLGLTYLAHTHVDTVWTQQGIELEKLEWTRRPDGGLQIERTLPNGLAFGVEVRPRRDAVLMEMWLQNGTSERLADLRVQNCVMTKMAVGFAQQTNDNKVFTNPYVACRSETGDRWIITAWENCDRPWGNADCPCFHSDPKFPDLGPGQKHRLRGWLSFYEGSAIQAEFDRIEGTGWRHNGENGET